LLAQTSAWAEAAAVLEEALPLAGANESTLRAQIQRARADLFEGPLDDLVRAKDALTDAAALASGDARLRLRLGMVIVRHRAPADLTARAEATALFDAVRVDEMQPLDVRIDAYGCLAETAIAYGDGPAAEASLRDALAIDPRLEGAAFAKLEAHHARHLEGDASLARTLTELTASGGDPRWIQRLGELEVHRLGRTVEGLAHLRAAVTLASAPAVGRAIGRDARVALAEGLLRAREPVATEEAARLLRDVVVQDPAHARALEAAQTAFAVLGRSDEASVVAETRAYFGFGGDQSAVRSRRMPPTGALRLSRVEPIGDAAMLQLVVPESARITPLEILGALSDQLSDLFPCDLGALGLTKRDRVGARGAHPFRAHVDRAASVLGVKEIDLFVHDAPEPRIFADFLDVPAVFVPSSISALPELEIAFAIGRVVARVATGTYLLDKLAPSDVEELVAAAVAPYGAPISTPKTRGLGPEDELARRLQRAVSRKAKKHLEEIAQRVSDFDGVRFARGLAQSWSRSAYLTTGDLTSALDHLRRYEEVGLDEMGQTEALPGDLLRFALSEGAARLRRQVGSTWV
jgi:hypothetical protein